MCVLIRRLKLPPLTSAGKRWVIYASNSAREERRLNQLPAAPVPDNEAHPVELDDVCRTKLKLPYQTNSDAALFAEVTGILL